MSVSATANASDQDLLDLGLSKKRDFINVKKYCKDLLEESGKQKRNVEKLELLQNIMQTNPSKRKLKDADTGYTRSKRVQESQLKKVHLGWVHFDEKQNKYIGVRTPRGGGPREVSFPSNASAEDIIEVAKELYFPDGMSCYGLISSMDFKLANFKQAIIESLKIDGQEVSFTLSQYIHATKLSKVSLYLASKKKSKESHTCTKQSSSSGKACQINLLDDDKYLYNAVFDFPVITPDSIMTDQYHDNNNSDGNSREHQYLLDIGSIGSLEQPETSELVDHYGGSQATTTQSNIESMFDLNETRKLKMEQDEAYMDSLSKDKAKTDKRKQELAREVEELEEQEKLQQMRLSRVPEDQSPGKDTVLIKVKHVTLGTIKRHFAARETMISVYDWVGSQSLLPMYFGIRYKPDQSVQEVKAYTLHMVECTKSAPNIDDDDVTFKGLGSHSDNFDDTIPLELQDHRELDNQHPEITPAVPDNQQSDM